MGKTVYDWPAIRAFHEAGHTLGECQRRFGFANGALHSAIERGAIAPLRASRAKPRGVTRNAVAELLAAGRRPSEVATILGVSRPTVCHHMRALGIPAQPRFGRRFDWVAIQRYYDEGHSRLECQQRFGFSNDAWAQAKRRCAITPRERAIPVAQLFVAGPRRNRFHLKYRLLAAELKANRCEQCGTDHLARRAAVDGASPRQRQRV